MFKSEDGSLVRPTAKAEETRRRILAAALDLFQERGFTETTMREIARRAEVATGAAYYYFPSKEAIIMAFYWQTHTEFEAAFRKPLARTRDLADRIRFLVELKLEQFQPYRAFLARSSAALAIRRARSRPSAIRRATFASRASTIFGSPWRDRTSSSGGPRHAPAAAPLDLPDGHHPVLDLRPLARQARTRLLLEKSSDLIARAIKLSRFRVLKPFRDAVLGLLESVAHDGPAGGGRAGSSLPVDRAGR